MNPTSLYTRKKRDVVDEGCKVEVLDKTASLQQFRPRMRSHLVFLYPADSNGGAGSHSGRLPFKLTRFQEGVHLVVPPEFLNFFTASTGAGAALVGLLFVAVSLAPEQIVTLQAPVERQAVAGSAFTALINAFFI
jgi:hypothetical protein